MGVLRWLITPRNLTRKLSSVNSFCSSENASQGGEYAERVDINSLKLQFHFAQIIMGKGCGTTDRDLESVSNKRNVLKIVNDDNNCFWCAMACLTNPGNRTARDSRYPKHRIKLRKDLCNKARCDWDKSVSFLHVPLVEEKLLQRLHFGCLQHSDSGFNHLSYAGRCLNV